MRAAKIAHGIGGIVLILSLGCNESLNPFDDASLARAHVVEKSFASDDSIPVFSTESLTVVVSLRESVDSFSVILPANRLDVDNDKKYPDTVVTYPTAPNTLLNSGNYTVPFSFFHSGLHTLKIITHRSNRESFVSDSFALIAYSPLRQDSIAASFGPAGAKLKLSTPALADEPVFYHWRFKSIHGDTLIQSLYSSVDATLLNIHAVNDTGYLWASSLDTSIKSTPVPFVFTLGDGIGPTIAYGQSPNGIFVEDTTSLITTSDTVFYFQTRIADIGVGVKSNSVLINGARVNAPINGIYTHQIENVKTLAKDTLYSLHVYAADLLGNPARDTFFLKWDASVPVRGVPSAWFRVFAPRRETPNEIVTVVGQLLSPGNNNKIRADIQLTVNGRLVDSSITIDEDTLSDIIWSWDNIRLSKGDNTLDFKVKDYLSDTQIDTSLTVVYNSSLKDEDPPDLISLTIENETHFPSGNQSKMRFLPTEKSVVSVDIAAVDEISRITSVKIATTDSAYFPELERSFLWKGQVDLNHGNNLLTITLIDENDNAVNYTASILQNIVPAIELIESVFVAHTNYTGIIRASDPDGKNIDIVQAKSEKILPENLPIVKTRIYEALLGWEPQSAGTSVLRVTAADDYDTVTGLFSVLVRANVTTPSHPVSLDAKVINGNPVANGDTLDYSHSSSLHTLEVKIVDADPPSIDSYLFRRNAGGVFTEEFIDSPATILLNFDASAKKGFENWYFSISDENGSSDSVGFTIMFDTASPVVNPGDTSNIPRFTFNPQLLSLSENVGRYPLLIRLNQDFDFASHNTISGNLVFYDPYDPDSTSMSYQMEVWDSTNKSAAIWLLLDSLDAAADSQVIELAYDSLASFAGSGPSVFGDYAALWNMYSEYGINDQAGGSMSLASVSQSGNADGVIGYCQQFDGLFKGFTTSGTDPTFLAGKDYWSISLWIKPDTGRSNQHVLSKMNYSTREGFFIRLDHDTLSLNLAEASWQKVASARVVGDQWNYVAFAYRAGMVYVYLNGTEAIAGAASNARIAVASQLLFGYNSRLTSYFAAFNGLIDEVRIIDSDRSSDYFRSNYLFQRANSVLVRHQIP
ncbi:MAG: hypothetical protein GF398_09155 [Chitinivibrionales bacterium]|nr:hypothetical protein [Chitinivibrionales bacterium]